MTDIKRGAFRINELLLERRAAFQTCREQRFYVHEEGAKSKRKPLWF